MLNDFNKYFTGFRDSFKGAYSSLMVGSSVSLAMKLVGMLAAYLFAFSVTTFMGAEAWGVFSLSLSLLIFGSIIGTAGLDSLLLKISSSEGTKPVLFDLYRKSAVLCLFASAIVSLIIFFSAESIAVHLFHNNGLKSSFEIAAIAVPAYAFLNMNAGTLQGLKRLQKFVFLRFVSHHIGGLIFFLALVLILSSPSVVMLAYTASLYLITLLSFAWVRREKKRTEISERMKKTRKELLVQSTPFMTAALLFFAKSWIDTIMIGMFMESSDVGIYTIALKLTALLGVTLSAVSAVATPQFSEAYSARDNERLRKNMQRSSAIVFYTSSPVFLALLLFPGEILSIFGPAFREGSSALMILATGGFINTFFGLAGYFMKMTGGQVPLQNITLISVVAGILLNLWLIPALGINGAAIATLLSIFIWNLMSALYIKINFDLYAFYLPFKKIS